MQKVFGRLARVELQRLRLFVVLSARSVSGGELQPMLRRAVEHRVCAVHDDGDLRRRRRVQQLAASRRTRKARSSSRIPAADHLVLVDHLCFVMLIIKKL